MTTKKQDEVDFLIDDREHLTILPLEIKSGKDYRIHSALDRLLSANEYNTREAIVFSNAREVERRGQVTYFPIYYAAFLEL